ncbi:hypothetical protein [Geomicrobium sp. JCM 19055]|uniref:hypothetical protein n=1 Tax=Geomicrobium sp. JCM 19055 TaxID=1460649 RepID=UPI0022355FE3|nr:hypothetical protein [Geomicrobium sp. JCM 19055]
MLITTSRKPTLPMLQKAKRLSHEWNVPHLAREKRTIASMHHTDTAVYMVGKNGKDVLYNKGHDDFFFSSEYGDDSHTTTRKRGSRSVCHYYNIATWRFVFGLNVRPCE